MRLALKQKCLLSIALTFIFCPSIIFAQLKPDQKLNGIFDPGVPAYPEPITYSQPNGQKITIRLKGDGALNWAETTDGYKLIANNKGAFCYAIEDKEQGIKVSNIEASEANMRNQEEVALLRTINRSAFFSPSYIQKAKSNSSSFLKGGSEPQRAFPSKGNRKLIAILVEFSDVPFSKTRQDFDDLFNKKGYSYNGATGSVSDYFYDNSFGTMSLNVDVVGPFKLSHNMSYYGAKDGTTNDINPKAMVTEAVALANPTVDFSQYDNDQDGVIDGVYIIFSGYGQEAGASTNAIWSHAWSIPTVTYDNTKISRYSCSPELKGNENNNWITKYPTHIGVICHEFLHVCGLPDYYDTDGIESGGDSRDLGSWDPMAGGSWNNGGRTPPYVNCYSRTNLGWGTIESLSKRNGITLEPFYKSNVAYGISTITDEHYFFENRQQQGWDTYIPWHGMIVYHMQYDASRWKSNKVNVYPTHQCFDLVEAVTNNPSDRYSPFPGLGKVTSFSVFTNPAFANWDGSSLNNKIDNITENGQQISFDVADYKMRNIDLKLTHDGSSITEYEVTYKNEKYTANSEGIVKLQISEELMQIEPTFTIGGSTTFTKQVAINTTDNVYSIPLKRIDFRYSGSYAKTPTTTITIPQLAVLNLSGLETISTYTPNFASPINYTIKFDNGREYSQNLVPNPSLSTDLAEIAFNQYVVSITSANQKVHGYELDCNGLKYQSNNNGEIVAYIPISNNSITLASTSNAYHPYQNSFANSGTASNIIPIEIMKRNQMETMTIAPNPIRELPMVIFVSEDGIADFYNPMGNKLFSQDVKVGKNLISAKGLKKGVILVRFRGKETIETKRALIL